MAYGDWTIINSCRSYGVQGSSEVSDHKTFKANGRPSTPPTEIHPRPRSPRSLFRRLHVPILYLIHQLNQDGIAEVALAHVGRYHRRQDMV